MIQTEKPQIKLATWRSYALFALLVLGFLGLTGRAVYLQGMHHDFLQEKGECRYSRIV